jgi:hypothetical protein
VEELDFFPAMNLPVEEKLKFVGEILEMFSGKFEIVNMREHADFVRRGDAAVRRHGEIAAEA